ncbi:hypothetical protein AcV5_004253 [Taiwanofungus camphoratus]|nr:hypothetical protein AcW2_001153 [Antrodia cinnamomea]KAI0935997.1 hypothetical protein AcV5_004253 [Antrodia cinnamomea]KAI0961214.1 hypothetical protein AcV7_000372 [Antrodia cinnamomea]
MSVPEPCLTPPIDSDVQTLSQTLAVPPMGTGDHYSIQETMVDVALPSYDSLPPCHLSSLDASRKHTSSSTLVVYVEPSEPRISTLRLLFAHAGAALTLFLATTDATIVSTILPTIASRLRANDTQYTWLSVTYMLTQTAFQPLYGKLSDLIGRRPVLYSSIFIFAVGSALCGAAQTMEWIIAARALAGVGGGGIVSLVWTITSEIVEVRNQAKWSQALSVTWACSAVAGPLLGGIFSGESGVLSWRWAFFLNLPICAVASTVLWLSLRNVNLEPAHDISWQSFWRTFDFLGLVLFMTGSICIVIGFNVAAATGWTAASTLTLIVAGFVILISAACYEVRTKRDALFPPVVFQDPTIVIILVIIFLHNFAFNAGTFYLALFFQAVGGFSPLRAGIRMLPYSLGSSLASMPAAWFIGYWQKRHLDTSGQKFIMCVGLAISTLGFGVMMLLTGRTSPILQSVYPLIAGVGIGMLFHAPYQVFTRALRRRDTASGTSAFFLVRFTGATVGLTVSGAVFDDRLSKTLPSGVQMSTVLASVRSMDLTHMKYEVVSALSLSIRTIWAVCCPCLGIAFVISIFMRNLSIESEGKSTGSTLKQSSLILAKEASV